MKPPEDVIITDFNKGIAQTPHLGFGDMRNIDIWSEPGVAKIAWSATKKSSTTITGTPRWTTQSSVDSSLVYFVDTSNKVYSSVYGESSFTNITGAKTVTGGTGDGLIYWKGHIFAMRDTQIDVYKISTTTWYNNWGAYTLTSGSGYHPAVWSSNDDNLYIGHGRYVMKIVETGTFDAATAGTWNVSTVLNALDLPANYLVKTMRELGNNLMIGTWRGSGIADSRTADIFPWDRSSASYDLPIQLKENGINQMINVNNQLYVQAGVYGNWYITNGSNTTLFKRMSKSIFSFESGRYVRCEPDAVFHRENKIYFGMSVGASSFDGSPTATGATTMAPLGVWSMDLISGALVFESQISSGNTANLSVGTLFSVGSDTYTIGWHDAGASTQGVDLVGNAYRYPSYAAYIESPFIQVGLILGKKALRYIEFYLSEDLVSGTGIKLKYRTDLSASFTTIGTYDYSTLGAVKSHRATADIPECEFVQVRVEMTTGASSSSTPKLKSIRLV